MKKLLIFSIILLASSQKTFSQTAKLDSIFTIDSVIVANVKEITPDLIKYNVPDMEVTTSIYRNIVKKIQYKTGQTQVFKESINLENVESAYDSDKVRVSNKENETKGLIKLGVVYASVFGETPFSTYENIFGRAVRKLKIQAAMLGGNLVYFSDKFDQVISGSVYSNILPKMEDFERFNNDKHEYTVYNSVSISVNRFNLEESIEFPTKVVIEDIYQDDDFIYIKSKKTQYSDNQVYRVVCFSKNHFVLTYLKGNRIYNLFLLP